MKKKDVYNKAKATWGIDAQITKAVEELAELQKELCRFLLDDGNMEHITEEMADAKIMIEQMELILENKEAVKVVKKMKVQRLSERLDAENPVNKSCGNCKNEERNIDYISCKIGGFCHNHSGWLSNAK